VGVRRSIRLRTAGTTGCGIAGRIDIPTLDGTWMSPALRRQKREADQLFALPGNRIPNARARPRLPWDTVHVVPSTRVAPTGEAGRSELAIWGTVDHPLLRVRRAEVCCRDRPQPHPTLVGAVDGCVHMGL